MVGISNFSLGYSCNTKNAAAQAKEKNSKAAEKNSQLIIGKKIDGAKKEQNTDSIKGMLGGVVSIGSTAQAKQANPKPVNTTTQKANVDLTKISNKNNETAKQANPKPVNTTTTQKANTALGSLASKIKYNV